MPERSL
ncbi:hypothetical protein CGLO_02926 [Colletotrichum gloeosporioides Cg-14]|nr:hypothetical protein CGLO_02926 [Colletotrichum gloeosporioides Cg-14]